MRRTLYIFLGCFSFALGFVGALLPVLPTTPFLLLSGFFFTRSSRAFDDWLKGTSLYQFYVADYEQTRSIPREKKKKIVLNVLLLMGFSIYFAPITWVKAGLTLLTCGICYVILRVIPDTPDDQED